MNTLPHDILFKIQLYLQHPCAKMVLDQKDEIEDYTTSRFQQCTLYGYRCSHPRTQSIRKYNAVIRQLNHIINHIWFTTGRNRMFHYKKLLIVNKTQDFNTGSGDDFHTDSDDDDFAHLVVPGEYTDSDTDSDTSSDSSTSSDSDTPIIPIRIIRN